MMNRILFIDDKPSFIIKTIIGNLESEGYECNLTVLDKDKIEDYAKDTDMFFVNIVEEHQAKAEVYEYIQKICMEEEKYVFFVGYPDDLMFAKKMISAECIGGIFERPVNSKSVIDAISGLVAFEQNSERQKHILVVDDSGETLRMVKMWLAEDYHVSMANSATNAMFFLAGTIPDLILLDYEMPICSGPQMLEMLRSESRTAQIPVMFLTAKNDAESVKSVLALKPQGYLLKTHSPQQIIETIDNFFEQQKSELLKADVQGKPDA